MKHFIGGFALAFLVVVSKFKEPTDNMERFGYLVYCLVGGLSAWGMLG